MYHTNPENGLLKAIDLERVGQDEAALEALNIILASRRYRTWQPVHEKIMEKYIELSIKLRTSMRDAFVKYRSICQDTNVTSLENIINLYRNKAEARAELAREEAEKANSVEIDADFEESPGSIMLQAVSGEFSCFFSVLAVCTPSFCLSPPPPLPAGMIDPPTHAIP